MGQAPAAAALVEQHDAVALGVEHPALLRTRGPARAPVQVDGGLAFRIARDLVVDLVAVADVQQPRVVRCDRRVHLTHAADSSTAETLVTSGATAGRGHCTAR